MLAFTLPALRLPVPVNIELFELVDIRDMLLLLAALRLFVSL